MTYIFWGFFPVNISGAKFSDFCSMWKCATALIFDNHAVDFGILNDSREYFWLFYGVIFFFFLSLPVEESCDSVSKTIEIWEGKKV